MGSCCSGNEEREKEAFIDRFSEIEDKFQSANEKFKRRKFPEAKDNYDEIIRLDPTYAPA